MVNAMYELIEAVKIGLSLIFLSYASWQDYKYREVSNEVWMFFAPLGLFFTIFHIFLTQQFFLFISLVTSSLVVSGISVILFYLGFFGGADAKAFICLSITLPFSSILFKPLLKVISTLFSLSIFNNSIISSALTAVVILFYNISWRIKTGERLFEALEQEPSWKKFLALITGYKVELSKFKKNPHLVPLEEISEGEDGKAIRQLKVFIKVDENKERFSKINKFSGNGKIWVTPNLPFIIFITIGLVINLILGDVILWLTSKLISFSI